MKPSKNISRLVEIMAALRTPDTGCPWDLEQDFKSIAPYTIEEAYEVADAVERGDMEDLRLELGDLLLQSVYHARLAEEAGHFGFEDVIEGITQKMIRRHPHVFGDANGSAEEYSALGMAKGTWERIKAEEKAEIAQQRVASGLPPKPKQQSLLDDVPTTLPGLALAVKLQNKASKVGFDWNDPRAVIDKIREEIGEVEEVLDQFELDQESLSQSSTDQSSVDQLSLNMDHLEDEIGDVLFAIANLARHLDIDPDKALRRSNSKFRNRFRHIEDNIKDAGHTMESADLETMDKLWNQSKKHV